MYINLVFILLLGQVFQALSVQLDLVDCGIDHDTEVSEGDVEITQYPWLGILYYTYYGDTSEERAVTTVALIQAEFVIGSAADIGPMPKRDFRDNSVVLLGQHWNFGGHRVRSYVLHPEYGETYNTVALVQLRAPVRTEKFKPLCPPPDLLRNPQFYVVKFKEGDDYNELQKQVIPVTHVPPTMCKEFYVRANLYSKKMRPPHVSCAVSLTQEDVCVWNAGAALVSRDVWGRWQLLGVSVRGPGCGAPSRYLDMMSYYPWIEASLDKFRRITISKITKQKYVLRTAFHAYQKFGNCDEGERVNLIYREMISLRTDNTQYQFLTYNMSILQHVEYSCLTMELINASATSEMRVKHLCTRGGYGVPCYNYKGSAFDISVYLMFSDTCLFEMFVWGFEKNMTLLDIQEWKWEEGTYYEDFSVTEVEYRGRLEDTEFGFEPIDEEMWVPDYDVWSTTPPPDPNITSTTRDRKGDSGYSGTLMLEPDKRPTVRPKVELFGAMMTGEPNPVDRFRKRPTTKHKKKHHPHKHKKKKPLLR